MKVNELEKVGDTTYFYNGLSIQVVENSIDYINRREVVSKCISVYDWNNEGTPLIKEKHFDKDALNTEEEIENEIIKILKKIEKAKEYRFNTRDIRMCEREFENGECIIKATEEKVMCIQNDKIILSSELEEGNICSKRILLNKGLPYDLVFGGLEVLPKNDKIIYRVNEYSAVVQAIGSETLVRVYRENDNTKEFILGEVIGLDLYNDMSIRLYISKMISKFITAIEED